VKSRLVPVFPVDLSVKNKWVLGSSNFKKEIFEILAGRRSANHTVQLFLNKSF